MRIIAQQLTRTTLLSAIVEAHQGIPFAKETYDDMGARYCYYLRSMAYAFLVRFDMPLSYRKMFCDILEPGDIETLSELHRYNYCKLKTPQ